MDHAPTNDDLVLPAGAVLFKEGDPCSYAYVIVSGRVEIVLSLGVNDIVLCVRGPGEIIGEMAILDGGARSASARVIEDCTLNPISLAQIQHRLLEADPILRHCFGVIIARFRETMAFLQTRNAAPPSKPSTLVQSPPAVQLDFDASVAAIGLEHSLRRAIDRQEFELFFQPVVRLATGRLAGFEALIRWRHPEGGLVSPLEFIPLAEASGLIVEITAWVITEVGRVMPEIMRAALANPTAVESPIFLSLNISSHDLADASLPNRVVRMLHQTGTPPECLKLEITESVLMRDPDRATNALNALRQSGIGIAIDDFGTGYSSLSYLTTFPITALKADRAFVRAMLSDPRDRKIVQVILRLADELGIAVVAEGIEEPAQAKALAQMGCAFGQGYHYGRPVPLTETIGLIRSWILPSLDCIS